MRVLIDGNNLQYAALDANPERPPGREQLCRMLGAWARSSGEAVHIVFDGPEPASQRAQQIQDSAITVSYSGSGIEADDVLIRMIDADSAARRLVVVSTDRRIRDAARRRGATAERSAAFWKRVRAGLARSRPPALEPKEKETGLSEGETEAWLRELGLTGRTDDPADTANE